MLHGEVSARYVPFAAIGITLFTWDFASAVVSAANLHLATVAAILHAATGWRMLGDLLLLSVCGGLFSVPLYAIVQEQSEPSHRARTIAANNVVNAVMLVSGAGFVAASAAAHLPAPRVLQITALVNAAVALWTFRLLPRTRWATTLRRPLRWPGKTRTDG